MTTEESITLEQELRKNTLSEMKALTEELGKRVWSLKDEIKLEDIMLYGSVARNEPYPNDVDILILHQNPIFDEFQFKYAGDSVTPEIDKFNYLITSLGEEGIKVVQALEGRLYHELIEKELLNTIFMNTEFFTNSDYRLLWRSRNCWDLDFDKKIFHDGLLWNPEISSYNIKAQLKYKLPDAA